MFTDEQLDKIEKLKNAKFVCETSHEGKHIAVFYGDVAHPVSGSRYFGLYYSYSATDKTLLITDGAFIEKQTIDGIRADNDDVIYSTYRHDFVTSPDGSVSIDGGRDYTKVMCKTGNFTERRVTLLVRDGVMRILEDHLS